MLGGTLRLTKQQGKDFDRLQSVNQSFLAAGLLSVDY